MELQDVGSKAVVNAIGFNDAKVGLDFTVPVEFAPSPADGSVGRTVGIALANPNSASATVALKLLDAAGQVLATATLGVPQMGQIAIDLGSLPEFKAVLPASNLVGAVTVASTQPIGVIALGDDYGPFYATPPINAKAK